MNEQVVQPGGAGRAKLVRRGRHLEYFTIGWNSLEGLAAIIAGLLAGSIALVGFGFDSIKDANYFHPVQALVQEYPG